MVLTKKKKSLLIEDEQKEKDVTIKINKDFAKKYEEKKQKEELSKCFLKNLNKFNFLYSKRKI